MNYAKIFTIILCLIFISTSLGQAQEPKKIAILQIGSAGNINNWWSGYGWGSNFAPGSAIEAALTSKLINSPKYLVFDRENLDAIMREQNLGQSGVISPETAVEIGKIIGVKYIVTGVVTEFDLMSRGDRGRVAVPIRGFRIGVGGKSSDVVRVSCEIKVTDVETGLISAAMSSRKEIGTGSSGLGGFYKGYEFSGRGGELPSSGLGKGLYEVAADLANQMDKVQFKEIAARPKLSGYVVYSEGDKVFINLSNKDGIFKNTIFNVTRARQVKDPRTGAITNINRTVAEIKVINVGDSSTECVILSGNEPIQPNDSIVQK